MKNCGIYQIRNLINGKVYIGSAVNLKKRERIHFSNLKNNKHKNIKLQRAYNFYSKEKFIFEHLLYCDKFLLLFSEQILLDYYWDIEKENYKDNCYNISKIAGSNLGKKHSIETK